MTEHTNTIPVGGISSIHSTDIYRLNSTRPFYVYDTAQGNLVIYDTWPDMTNKTILHCANCKVREHSTNTCYILQPMGLIDVVRLATDQLLTCIQPTILAKHAQQRVVAVITGGYDLWEVSVSMLPRASKKNTVQYLFTKNSLCSIFHSIIP